MHSLSNLTQKLGLDCRSETYYSIFIEIDMWFKTKMRIENAIITHLFGILWKSIMIYFIISFHYAIYYANWHFIMLEVYKRFFK